jgi:hypothetical protein
MLYNTLIFKSVYSRCHTNVVFIVSFVLFVVTVHGFVNNVVGHR